MEYRVAHGEALDAQMWTKRNWTMRILTFLGVLASGSEFAFKEQGIVKGIGAFTGQVVPAAGVLWPDGTIAQLDRISDLGFRTNKVIFKEGSDIIVAFFPIDRFVTPELKKLFLKSPSVFFVQMGALVDKSVRQDILDILSRYSDDVKPNITIETLLENSKLTGFLDGISLNKVQVAVSGVMSIDVDTVPARVDSVTFDDPTVAWDGKNAITGVVQGVLLSNGQPTIVEAKDLGITAQAVPDQSTSEQLHFKVQLSKAVPAGTSLHFHVTKQKNNKTVDSNQISVPGTPKSPEKKP
jgi:hypothetical protein